MWSQQTQQSEQVWGAFRYGHFVEEAVGYVEKEVMGLFPGAAGSQRLGNMGIFGGYRNIAEQ